jgi:hypothetical protein
LATSQNWKRIIEATQNPTFSMLEKSSFSLLISKKKNSNAFIDFCYKMIRKLFFCKISEFFETHPSSLSSCGETFDVDVAIWLNRQMPKRANVTMMVEYMGVIC